jgi:hypothetical protein
MFTEDMKDMKATKLTLHYGLPEARYMAKTSDGHRESLLNYGYNFLAVLVRAAA